MRIVIATPFYPPQVGVLATYASGLEGALQRAGHEVRVVVSRPLPPGVRHVDYFVRIFRALFSADTVLALDIWTVGMPTFFVAKVLGKKFTVRIGGDPLWEAYVERTHQPVFFSRFYDERLRLSRKERLMYTWFCLLTRHATLFFNSRFQMDIWGKAYAISESRMHLLENYYPEHVAPQPRSSDHGGEKIFVAAVRGAYFKNPGILARAFARVKETYPTIDLDMRILSFKEQQKRLRECYAVIIPSISEINSNTAIEAVAEGKPFIISKDTGTGERLKGCGLFVDTRSEDELVRALETLLDQREYEKLQGAMRASPFAHSWDEIARDIIQQI